MREGTCGEGEGQGGGKSCCAVYGWRCACQQLVAASSFLQQCWSGPLGWRLVGFHLGGVGPARRTKHQLIPS